MWGIRIELVIYLQLLAIMVFPVLMGAFFGMPWLITLIVLSQFCYDVFWRSGRRNPRIIFDYIMMIISTGGLAAMFMYYPIPTILDLLAGLIQLFPAY